MEARFYTCLKTSRWGDMWRFYTCTTPHNEQMISCLIFVEWWHKDTNFFHLLVWYMGYVRHSKWYIISPTSTYSWDPMFLPSVVCDGAPGYSYLLLEGYVWQAWLYEHFFTIGYIWAFSNYWLLLRGLPVPVCEPNIQRKKVSIM